MTKNTQILGSATFAFLDIETTGGNSSHDRITEIGIRFWRAGEVVGEWQTLINPETRISPFIESLTGISDAMVADAPVFEDITGVLEEQLKDTIFVAHNARFDYGFIKAEFRRLGLLFSAKVLCTVKLSRTLYPGFRRHNMDALIERHHLEQVQRHRALGDVSAMMAFFEHALAEKGSDAMEAAIRNLLQSPSIPSNLPTDVLQDLPRGPGVYRFYGENDVLLYVGKSTNIAQRVASHFSGDHNSSRGIRMSESLRRVDWTETAGELGALLLELKQIKQLKPLFNRRSRAAKNLVSIELAENSSGYLQARLVWEIEPHRLGDYFGLFRSKKDAEKALSGIAAKNDLCNKLLGLEPDGDGPCFQRSLGRCRGACDGGEDVVRYNLRTQIAFHGLRLKTWPWKGPVGVVEHNVRTGRTDILVVYNWMHVATLQGMDEIGGLSLRDQAVNFDLDSYKLVVKALMGQDGRSLKVIELDAVGAPDVLMP
ncbi:exonuclease domain-containing protein [Marinobacter salarius]|jgi:DNA polymerase-3 subunit epsilon|uniref:exonuclease domain-containing protein n=1 Tax=Marinobacter salarius TaxID=1420917 RepID=UPI0010A9CEB1|nr:MULTISPECIES: exonuclease domain-containing protein [Marinobacter]MBJ7301328.1 GIY-YIG nuclease family protein [Marinobacter salarius]HIO31498.1 DNA polymerase III subunit epsilon [Marinobacter salarius]HIO98398.1 DNA polymerase III subunit epsilon [Marinobacter salarius]